MAWAWSLEAAFFVGAALVQAVLAGALMLRHDRQEWAWVLAVLFAFNGAAALVRGLLVAVPATEACGAEACGPVLVRVASAVWFWFEPATLPLLAYFFLIYPERPAWGRRHPALLRAAVFGPFLLYLVLALVGRESPLHPAVLQVLSWERLLEMAAGWCIILLRGASTLPRIASPTGSRQFGFLYAVVGMRAAHIALLQFMGHLEGLVAPAVSLQPGPAALSQAILFAAPVAALAVAGALLLRARPRLPASQARNAGVALSFLGAGAFLAFLPGPGGLLAGPGWGLLLTHYDLYVLRPAVAWIAVVQPRFPGRGGAALPAGYAGLGAFAATVPAFADAIDRVVFLSLLGLLCAAACAALVAFLARPPTPDAADPGADRQALRRRARQVDAYAAALEMALGHPRPSPEALHRLQRLRRRLRISDGQHQALERAMRGAWAGPPPGEDWQPGDLLLSRYEVVCFLGQGGSGQAYRCRDILADRDVVLKRTQRLDAAGRRALATEAAALARMRSPRIVACFGVVAVAGEPVLVLEWMPGGSLQGRLARQGPLTAAQGHALARDLLEALQAAHGAGIVHGDLKPSNVLLDARGRAVLADFGAARPLPGPDLARSTQDGPPPGSLRYMAPEQVQGLPADERTDLYALAVLLCEATTGAHPLDLPASDLGIRQAILRGRPHLPGQVPAPLRRALRQALSVDPALRPSSAQDLAARLGQPPAAPQARSRRRLRPTPMTSPG